MRHQRGLWERLSRRSDRNSGVRRTPTAVVAVESLEERSLMATGVGVDLAGMGTRVDQVVAQILAQYQIPGMAVAVTYHGNVVINKGYGLADVPTQTPVTSSTGFAVGSVSKTFTAEAVLLIAQSPSFIKKPGISRLELDLPISAYLSNNSSFTLPEKWKAVTTRQLLNMSSGIQDAGKVGVPWYDVVKQIGDDPLLFPPGTEYLYSNTGYWLLGELIGQLTEQPYSEFITDQILEPFGMNETTILTGSETSVPGQATGYQPFDPQTGTWHKPNGYYAGDQIFSAGAIVTTANDLGKYLTALWHRELLSPTSYNLMWTPTALENFKTPTVIATPGLGWSDGDGVKVTSTGIVINKNGAIPGYSSQVSLYLGQGFGIALSVNVALLQSKPYFPPVGQFIEAIDNALMTGALSGVVSTDPNGSGSLEPGDTRLAGWQVYLDGNNNGQLDPGELSTLTNGEGGYTFDQVEAGPVIVRVAPPAGWAAIAPGTGSYALNLDSSEVRAGLNFGVGLLPRVSALARQGRGRSLGVTIRFNEPLDPATVANPASYTVLVPFRNRRLGTKGLVPVRVRVSSYDPASNSVTLTSRRNPFVLNQALQVIVKGSEVKGTNGLALDGIGDGQPGSNFVGTLTPRLAGRRLRGLRVR